jgi:hypothetical protein
MRLKYKTLLVTAALSAAVSAQAAYNGDLLVGFYKGGVANTFVYDIGSFSSLYNGEQWSLGSQLTGAGFAGGTPGSGTSFGVVGFNTGSQTIYATLDPISPMPDTTFISFDTTRAAISALGNNQGAVSIALGGGADWNTETISGTGATTFVQNFANPNAAQPDVATLYALATDGSAGQTAFLNFSLASDGTLTYGTVAVPEPSTIACAGVGFLLLAFRNRFAKA